MLRRAPPLLALLLSGCGADPPPEEAKEQVVGVRLVRFGLPAGAMDRLALSKGFLPVTSNLLPEGSPARYFVLEPGVFDALPERLGKEGVTAEAKTLQDGAWTAGARYSVPLGLAPEPIRPAGFPADSTILLLEIRPDPLWGQAIRVEFRPAVQGTATPAPEGQEKPAPRAYLTASPVVASVLSGGALALAVPADGNGPETLWVLRIAKPAP